MHFLKGTASLAPHGRVPWSRCHTHRSRRRCLPLLSSKQRLHPGPSATLTPLSSSRVSFSPWLSFCLCPFVFTLSPVPSSGPLPCGQPVAPHAPWRGGGLPAAGEPLNDARQAPLQVSPRAPGRRPTARLKPPAAKKGPAPGPQVPRPLRTCFLHETSCIACLKCVPRRGKAVTAAWPSRGCSGALEHVVSVMLISFPIPASASMRCFKCTASCRP